jgi:hypothetical protein
MAKNTTKQGVLATEGSEAAPQLDLFEGPDDTAAAFLDRWTDDQEEKKEPASDQTEVDNQEEPAPEEEQQDEPAEEAEDSEDPEETEEDEETEDDEEESEETEEDDESEKVLDENEVVEVKVDDQTLKVSVKDLKRLYGQEAALTKKSQQVAQKRKEVEAQSTKLNATLERMYKKATEKWEPYSKVDMLIAAKTLDAEEFTALRNAANAAYEEFQYITQEVDTYIKETQQEQQTKLQEAAKEAVKVLKEQIPGWNQELYGKITSYGISQGLDPDMMNNLVDPVAISLIHKARMYDEGQKVVTKKKVKTAKKIMKPAANPSEKFDSEKKARAEQKFRRSGDVDDAAELFLSRWEE